jgi:hypothetical protein
MSLLSKDKRLLLMVVMIHPITINKFNFGGVRGGVEKKEEEELKEQIDVKVSTKFQINLSTNG